MRNILLSSAHQSQARTCMSIAKANFIDPYSPSFGGWGISRDKTSRSNVTAESKTRPAPEALATEIVRSNPDVIFVVGPDAVIFKKLTSRIPIVVITTDPVKQGIAESLAHPGGNFTGVSVDAGLSIYGKRIALLRKMVPTMSKLGCLALRLQWNGPVSGPAIRAAAEAAGLPIVRRSRASPATVQMRS
jgi:ABC-type uncharacterized transport system substrate-binding protein